MARGALARGYGGGVGVLSLSTTPLPSPTVTTTGIPPALRFSFTRESRALLRFTIALGCAPPPSPRPTRGCQFLARTQWTRADPEIHLHSVMQRKSTTAASNGFFSRGLQRVPSCLRTRTLHRSILRSTPRGKPPPPPFFAPPPPPSSRATMIRFSLESSSKVKLEQRESSVLTMRVSAAVPTSRPAVPQNPPPSPSGSRPDVHLRNVVSCDLPRGQGRVRRRRYR